MTEEKFEELRISVPASWITVIDAMICARGGSQVVGRSKLLYPVLGEWVKQNVREATMVVNSLRGNPLLEQTQRIGGASPDRMTFDELAAQVVQLRDDFDARRRG